MNLWQFLEPNILGIAGVGILLLTVLILTFLMNKVTKGEIDGKDFLCIFFAMICINMAVILSIGQYEQHRLMDPNYRPNCPRIILTLGSQILVEDAKISINDNFWGRYTFEISGDDFKISLKNAIKLPQDYELKISGDNLHLIQNQLDYLGAQYEVMNLEPA